MSYWSSKALPWLIPSFLLTAPPGRMAILVSPWAEDVPVRIYRWEGRESSLEGEVLLSQVLRWLYAERNQSFLLVLRELDRRSEALMEAAGDCLELWEIPNLHAKLLITDRQVLRTSANLLTRSLWQNIETVDLSPNFQGDAMKFLREELGRFGILR